MAVVAYPNILGFGNFFFHFGNERGREPREDVPGLHGLKEKHYSWSDYLEKLFDSSNSS